MIPTCQILIQHIWHFWEVRIWIGWEFREGFLIRPLSKLGTEGKKIEYWY